MPNNLVYEPRGGALELWHSKDPFVVIYGGIGCVTGDTRIYDDRWKQHTPILDMVEANYAPIVMTLAGPVQATLPFHKGKAQIYRVTTKTGKTIKVTGNHLFLTPDGWQAIVQGNLYAGRLLAIFPSLDPSSLESSPSVHQQDVQHLKNTVEDSQCGCHSLCHSCGGQLPVWLDIYQGEIPSLNDVHEHTRAYHEMDDQETSTKCNHVCQCAFRHSRSDSYLQNFSERDTECHKQLKHCEQFRLSSCQCVSPSLQAKHLQTPFDVFHQLSGNKCLSSSPYDICSAVWEEITQIEPLGIEDYYDLHVPGAEHYIAEGFINHNTGKTRAALELIHYRAQHYPGYRGLILRKTRASLNQTTLVTFESMVAVNDCFKKELADSQRNTKNAYYYKNGSELGLGGLDAPQAWMGSEWDDILIDEITETTENDFEILGGRIRSGVAGTNQVIGACNPGAPTHYIKKRGDQGLIRLIESRHEDNPLYYDDIKQEWTDEGKRYLGNQQRNLKSFNYRRLILNEWCAAEGARFPYLRQEEHQFCMRKEWTKGLPSNYKLIIGMDYGKAAPFAAVWIAVSPKGDFYVYREVYEKGLDPYNQAQMVVDMTGQNEYIEQIFADNSCWSKETSLSGADQKQIKDYYNDAFRERPEWGQLIPGYKGPRENAWVFIDSLLTRNNGYPDLWIEENCVELWKEFIGLEYDPKQDGEKTRGPDHALDALKYAIYTGVVEPPKEDKGLPTTNEIQEEHYRKLHEQQLRDFKRRYSPSKRRRL